MSFDRIETDRLVLRRWTDADRPAFHAMNSDPAVMATLGPVMRRSESDAFMNRIIEAFDAQGYGLWCVEAEGEPVGFTGYMKPWFRDGIEIGWRMMSHVWGRGYAPEAATACLDLGFGPREVGGIGLDEVITFTAATNDKSIRVMEKLGFTRDPDGDFDHPSVPETSPLRPHVLYRMTAAEWATHPT